MLSKSEAEALGWRFVHRAEQEVRNLGAGLVQIIPGSHRAEKDQADSLINETAETHEKLLERITHFEDHLASRLPADPAPSGVQPEPAPAPVEPEPEAPAVTVTDANGEPVAPPAEAPAEA